MERSAPSPPAALLREARTRANLSQTDVARRAHVAQSVVSAYESGRREPAFTTLERLIAATGHRLDVRLEPAVDARPGLPDTPLGRRLRQRRRQVLAVAEKNGASNVKVFGSVARGEDTPGSDIDIMVDLSPRSSLVTLGRLERELSDVLGVPVDVVPAEGLREAVRAEAEREAIPL
jgi:predicted nucleotidyltransferase/DNA-binding XRE family transcriptional regulator